MTVRLITLSLRQVLRLLLLSCRSSRSKDLELLVLRQELAVLRRQVPHPKTKREERLVLTVLTYLRLSGIEQVCPAGTLGMAIGANDGGHVRNGH